MTQPNRITDRVERMFAHAVALSQDGRLRNTIYCLGHVIYILNQDYTVLIRFRLKPQEAFPASLSFRANDYDSREFVAKTGRMEFIRRTEKWVVTKSCRTPERSPEEVDKVFHSTERPDVNAIVLDSGLVRMLDRALSHIEFSAQGGQLSVVQRNIYDGNVSRISTNTPDRLSDFGPIGIRTQDFTALYFFADRLKWRFAPKVLWAESLDPRSPMECLVSPGLWRD